MTKISVYLDTGIVFSYEVEGEAKAREHAHAIVMTGYRHTPQSDDSVLEWYPPQRILKVKCEGGMSTKYTDTSRGT